MGNELNELKKSFRYLFDSVKGRYSLESYLGIVEKFADEQILKSIKYEYLEYVGGNCTVSRLEDFSSVKFVITLFFKDKNDTILKKEAYRQLSSSKFTKETIEELENTLCFEIESPEVM
nr:hypothetical protein [uncultured Oribacterium sp.]